MNSESAASTPTVVTPQRLCDTRDALVADLRALCTQIETGLTLAASEATSPAQRQRVHDLLRPTVRRLTDIAVGIVERATDQALGGIALTSDTKGMH